AKHATPDPEGTGVWAPDWDGNGQPARRGAHVRQPTPDPRMPGGQAPPGQPPGGPRETSTDFIPRQHGRDQLFTHQEPGPRPGPPGSPGARPGGPTKTRLDAKNAELLRRKRLWRRVRYACYALGLLLFLGPIVAFLIGYYAWDVPNAAVLGASSNSQI